MRRVAQNKLVLSYVIGVALGDGNLSNPNKRAIRLRVTCDVRYPKLIQYIQKSIRALLPDNAVSLSKPTRNCINISCYSNQWENWLEWKTGHGSKIEQKARVPRWIFGNREYIKNCLKGLIETDGSIYTDRTYLMVNFVTAIPELAEDVMRMMRTLYYKPNMQIRNEDNRETKHTIRISKNTESFIKELALDKS